MSSAKMAVILSRPQCINWTTPLSAYLRQPKYLDVSSRGHTALFVVSGCWSLYFWEIKMEMVENSCVHLWSRDCSSKYSHRYQAVSHWSNSIFWKETPKFAFCAIVFGKRLQGIIQNCKIKHIRSFKKNDSGFWRNDLLVTVGIYSESIFFFTEFQVHCRLAARTQNEWLCLPWHIMGPIKNAHAILGP